MAEITLGRYTVRPDANSWILIENKVRGKESKVPGEKYHDIVGFYPNLQSTLHKMLDLRLNASDASDLRGVIEEIRAFRRELAPAFEVALEEYGALAHPKYLVEEEVEDG
jgi:hypothetical protein